MDSSSDIVFCVVVIVIAIISIYCSIESKLFSRKAEKLREKTISAFIDALIKKGPDSNAVYDMIIEAQANDIELYKRMLKEVSNYWENIKGINNDRR